MEEIPEALRYQGDGGRSTKKSPAIVMLGVLGLGSTAIVSSAFYLSSTAEVNRSTSEGEKIEVKQEPELTGSKEEIDSSLAEDNLLGHYSYPEAARSDLKSITQDGQIKLRKAAAEKYLEMQAAAKADGIILKPISGFRSIQEQKYLFFRVKEERGQIASKRAEVSAPPNYSEHHTGYAIDIGDGKVPATNLSTKFEKTAAFRWLEANAARYSFELSFPRDNPQGISYEPWHWRYVGDLDSLETFYRARNSKQSQNDKLSN